MEPDFVCAAGIDVETGRHVRPIQNRRLRVVDCATLGGPYDIGTVLEFSRTRARPEPPEVEDHEYMVQALQPVGRLAAEEFWNVLVVAAGDRLQKIFGRELRRVRDTCATARGRGIASLGCVWPTQIVDIAVSRRRDLFGEHDSIRIELMMARSRFRFPVTDLRLFQLDEQRVNWMVNQPALDSITGRIQRNVPVILSVGLSRAWQRRGETGPRHWLQVNNIHLADDPLWSVAPDSTHR
ncbi:MAG TPA: hypothetical protein VMM78_01255 [Thermomicrobiales bacterium]|nr:hypothetical protein [Thermomicrobiales bacterium]